MRKELFETGKSVDAAIDSACEKLGCSREDCEWEIIDLPKKGFLGLKNTPAKVSVSVEIPDEEPVRETSQNEQKKPAEQRSERQKEQPKPPYVKNHQKTEKQESSKHEQRPEHKHAEKKARENFSVESKAEILKPEEISEKEQIAKNYLKEVLEAAGLKADYTVVREHGGSTVNIVGEGLGMIIGRRGETLDAIQYLTGLVANRGEGDYLRLTVDCGNYRLKRKETLESLAKRLANQVIKTNVSKTLEPMNPFERRIIHATVSEIEGVSSASVGEEPNRRVVITSPTARPAPRGGFRGDRRDDGGFNREHRGGPRRENRPAADGAEASGNAGFSGERSGRPPRDRRDDRRDGRGDRRGGSRGGPPRRSEPVPQGPPKQTPESEAITGISFGKIDLD